MCVLTPPSRARSDCTKSETRVDDKSADDYSLEGGATLHLVLALRGGAAL
jgi:hypothetical protein